jgi:hypothetical protein
MARPKGTGQGKSVENALQAAEQAASAVLVLDQKLDKLKDHHKKMFESIMAGDDELVVALKSGNQKWYTGITKMVDTVDGTRIYTSKLTLDSIQTLTPDSYERLRRIASSKVRQLTGEVDYRQYTAPIREFAKRYTPMALGTIVRLSQDAKKEEVQLKAATDILDRAGEREPEPEKDIIIPVQVNIMLTGDKGEVIQYGG